MRPNVNWLTFAVLICCLTIDAFVARYELKKGVELKSTILKADAMHTKSHYLTTGAVILGTVLIKIGLPPIIDLIIASFVVVFIGKLAFGIFKETSSVLSDKALSDGEKIKKIVESVNGVKPSSNQNERRRMSHFLGHPYHCCFRIASYKSSWICDEVSDEIQKAIPEIKDVTVHPEPR